MKGSSGSRATNGFRVLERVFKTRQKLVGALNPKPKTQNPKPWLCAEAEDFCLRPVLELEC